MERTSHTAVHVRSNNGYAGIVAARDYAAGERLLPLRGHIKDHASRYSIQVGVDRHLEPDSTISGGGAGPSPWKFLNHSCDPNLSIDLAAECFVARRPIAAGEELSFNYLTTEWEMATPFDCHCGSPNCFGRIAGFKHLTAEEQERLLAEVAPHIRKLRVY